MILMYPYARLWARGKGLHLLDTLDAESRSKGLHVYMIVYSTQNALY